MAEIQCFQMAFIGSKLLHIFGVFCTILATLEQTPGNIEINNKRGSGAVQQLTSKQQTSCSKLQTFLCKNYVKNRMDGWPYSAYNRLPAAAQPEFQQYSNNAGAASAQQLFTIHHQLRQAQAQQVHQYLPPSLVAAASSSSNQAKQQNSLVFTQAQTTAATSSSWKTNSNGLVIIPEPQKATSSRSYSNNSELLVETNSGSNSRTMRHATELKTSQPVFPGQPPPLSRFEANNKQNYSPQPPPRQSSQPPQRSSAAANINRTAFPGQQPPVPVRN